MLIWDLVKGKPGGERNVSLIYYVFTFGALFPFIHLEIFGVLFKNRQCMFLLVKIKFTLTISHLPSDQRYAVYPSCLVSLSRFLSYVKYTPDPVYRLQ